MSKAAVSAHARTTGFWRDRCGAVAVAVAVLLPVLIGMAGIGIEVGLWFAIQRQNQSAADAAAISAALEYAAQIESGVTTDPTAAATTAANCNLFSTSSSSSNVVCPLPSSASNTITLYPCYGFTVGSSCNTSSSDGALKPNAVQVVLKQPLSTTFANFVTAIWGPNVNTVTVTTTAIAALLPGAQTCLLALGSGNPPTGNTFSASTSATLNMPNCSLASLSTSGNSIQLSGPGNLTINAAAVITAGNILGSPPPNTRTNFPLQDPYKGVMPLPLSGSLPTAAQCVANGALNITVSGKNPSPGCYTSMSFSQGAQATFAPGLYYIDGGNLSITGLTGTAFVKGTGITIVLTKIGASSAGAITIDNSNACTATISLTGTATGTGLLQPSAKASQGLLFFQDPTAVTSNTPDPNVISGCATPNVTLNGAIYTPATTDQLQGNFLANVKGCTEFISQSFTFSGNLEVDDTGCSGITLNQAQIQQVYLAM